ncbi:Fe2+-dependent dioxygenase [Sphingomonas sp. RT2P30]|uniref:Fe2+-dependent dioxygenase n=1 Tax=Parasphingomonas halimpatiens TaxID=3096162 RepID=UPI002FC9C19A
MFLRIPDVLTAAELAQLRAIAARTTFVDPKKGSAFVSPLKNNRWLAEPEALRQSAQMVGDAIYRNESFRAFAFPKAMMPPVLTRYDEGMHYGIHVDSAFMTTGQRVLRSDLSCTVFVSDESEYEGGSLRIGLGSSDVHIKGKAGSAIVYPSTSIHEVEPVRAGTRLVVTTFIESRIADAEQRELLYELMEIGAIAGEKMDIKTYTRLQRVQQNLLRRWGDAD